MTTPPPSDQNGSLNSDSPSASSQRPGSDPAHPSQDANGRLSGADNYSSDPAGARGGSSHVDALNREYALNPGAGDAPPPGDQAIPDGPSFEHSDEDDKPSATRRVKTSVSDFFTPASKKAADPNKPKSAAQRKRELAAARRQQRKGLRYRGDRKKWWWIQAGIAAAVALMLLVLVQINTKATKDDIDSAVKEQLEESGRNFPEGDAVMWAGQVLRVWGTWNEKSADSREVQIAPYLTSGMDPQAGWNGKGKQEVLYASVNPEPKVLDKNHALVQAVYQVSDGSWRCASLPVYAYKPSSFKRDGSWAFSLSGNPTPTGCSPRTGAPNEPKKPSDKGMVDDADEGGKLAATFFPGFFAAWAASDQNTLAQYTAQGVRTMGLGGSMSSVPAPTIGDTTIKVPAQGGPKDNTVYSATVPVTWTVSGSTSQVTSVYTVRIRKNGDRWYVVDEPVATTQAPEAQGGGPAMVPNPADGARQTYPTPSSTSSTPPTGSKPSTGPSKAPAKPSTSASKKKSASPSKPKPKPSKKAGDKK